MLQSYKRPSHSCSPVSFFEELEPQFRVISSGLALRLIGDVSGQRHRARIGTHAFSARSSSLILRGSGVLVNTLRRWFYRNSRELIRIYRLESYQLLPINDMLCSSLSTEALDGPARCDGGRQALAGPKRGRVDRDKIPRQGAPGQLG